MIDKLILSIPGGIDISGLQEHLIANSLCWKPEKLSSRNALKVFNGNSCEAIHVLVTQNGATGYKVVSNPSRNFTKFDEFVGFLGRVFGDQFLITTSIREIHLAIDYELPFQAIYRGLQYCNKRKSARYSDGDKNTGFMLGSGKARLAIYDKYHEQKLKRREENKFHDPTTRIELRLKRGPIPSCLLELAPFFLRIFRLAKRFWLMSDITINDVVYLSPNSRTHWDTVKAAVLNTKVESEGLFRTKRALNRNGNFSRTYSRYFRLVPFTAQPCDLLRDSLAAFMTLDLPSAESK